MKRIFVIVSCLSVALLLAPGAARAEGARVWEDGLTLPTYEVGPPNPNPAFPGWEGGHGGRPTYPYPLLDTLTDHKVDKKYKAVFLENEYLKVTVLPEMGGKVWAIYDKTAQRDVLYTNHVVKYGIVAIRGAWISGGIEWNFPDGHTVTTVSPIDYTTRTEADGSAVVVVGDTERIQRMQWAVAIRLRPGKKYLETEVTLNNRREVPGRYWFWATGAAPATDDLRFVYPMREAYPHTFWPVFTFPRYNGRDVGTYRDVPNALSLFARNSYRDFFGCYYEKSDWGVVHVADHREVPGKKTWTWGNDDAGKIWIEKLTDSDGQYVEFQAGRYETQMEHQFIAPHRVEHFTEYWFPLNKMNGGFDEATRNGALHVQVNGARVQVTGNVNEVFDAATLVIEANGATVKSEQVQAVPEAAFTVTAELPASAEGKPVAVTLKAHDGRTLIRYRTDEPPDGNPEFKPATRPAPDPEQKTSAEQAYVRGLAADKKSNEQGARRAYLEALRRDPNFAPALVNLGLSFYRTGEYDRAAGYLENAIRRNPDSGDARYYLALVRRAQNRVREAREQLIWCVREGQHEQIARYELGAIALGSHDVSGALEDFGEAVRLDPRDLKARLALAIANRRAGRLDEAQREIDEVIAREPLDYTAIIERYGLLEARQQTEEAKKARGAMMKVFLRERDSIQEVVCDYLELGQADTAREILAGATGAAGPLAYPMWFYTLGYLYEQSGDHEKAKAAFAKGASGGANFVWPHRVEEIAVLQAAVKGNPEDGRAAYYLGNALASKGRREEALAQWETAAKFDASNAVAQRNLAHARWNVKHDMAGSLAAFARAIAISPDDHHLYVERDAVLAAGKQAAQRIEYLEQAPPTVRSRGAVVQSLADAYVDGGRFQQAIDLLSTATITAGEGQAGGLAIYRRALTGLARQDSKAGRHAEAGALYVRATEYPRNFGVGKPAYGSDAAVLMSAVAEFDKAGQKAESAKCLKLAADQPLASPTEPNEPWSENYYWKAVALDRLGRKDEARALWQRYARLADDQALAAGGEAAPEGAIRWVLAGAGLEALGQKQQATAAFRKALEIEPQNELARGKLRELK